MKPTLLLADDRLDEHLELVDLAQAVGIDVVCVQTERDAEAWMRAVHAAPGDWVGCVVGLRLSPYDADDLEAAPELLDVEPTNTGEAGLRVLEAVGCPAGVPVVALVEEGDPTDRLTALGAEVVPRALATARLAALLAR